MSAKMHGADEDGGEKLSGGQPGDGARSPRLEELLEAEHFIDEDEDNLREGEMVNPTS